MEKQVKALEMAVEEGLTFCDSAYITIAQKTSSTFLSADPGLITYYSA